jgi:hypothetical protein
LFSSIPEERPCASRASNFLKIKNDFYVLIKNFMYNFVRTKDKYMKMQPFNDNYILLIAKGDKEFNKI